MYQGNQAEYIHAPLQAKGDKAEGIQGAKALAQKAASRGLVATQGDEDRDAEDYCDNCLIPLPKVCSNCGTDLPGDRW